MSEAINYDRRRLLGTAAVTMAASRLGLIGAADAQSSKTTPADGPTITPGSHMSFGALKQIDAGVLKKRRRPSPRRSWRSTDIDRRWWRRPCGRPHVVRRAVLIPISEGNPGPLSWRPVGGEDDGPDDFVAPWRLVDQPELEWREVVG